MVWVGEIEGIGCPVVALRKHNGVPTDQELWHVRMVLEDLGLWDPAAYDEGRSNPGHYHVYVRKPRPRVVVKREAQEGDGVGVVYEEPERGRGDGISVDT